MEASNVKAMREALLKAIVLLEACDWPDDTPMQAVSEVIDEIKKASSAPPLNCEVGTTQEQEKRFETFCALYHLPKGKGCYSCPAIPTRSPHAFQRNACKINWLQMPYEPDTKKEERNDAE